MTSTYLVKTSFMLCFFSCVTFPQNSKGTGKCDSVGLCHKPLQALVHATRSGIHRSVMQKLFAVCTKCIFNSIIDCHHRWSPRSLPVPKSAPAVPVLPFNGRLVMTCCKFVLFPQEINILQWEIEFDQDRFKNIEDTWTEKYDRYSTYTVYLCGFFNCIEWYMSSSVPSLLYRVFWGFSVFLISYQILKDFIFLLVTFVFSIKITRIIKSQFFSVCI